MNFAFDKKTGQIAVPGMVSAIIGRSPLGTFYDLAQRGLSAVGYTDAMADRNQSAVNAFSVPGVTLGAMSVHNSNIEASIGVDPETGAASTVGAFSAVDMSQEGYGMVGFDLGAVASAIGTGTISDLGFTDFQDAAISGHLGHGPLGIDEEEAITQAIAANFSEAGLDTAQGIASAAEQASQATAAFAAELEAFTGLDITSLEAVDVAGRAGALSASQAAAVKDMAQTDPIGVLGARMSAFEKSFDFGVMTEPEARKSAAEAIDRAAMAAAAAEAALSLSYDDGGYNSPNPTAASVEVAEQVMSITGKNQVDPNDPEQQRLANMIANNRQGRAPSVEAVGGTEEDFGYGDKAGSIGPSGIDAPSYEAAGAAAAMDAPDIDFGEGETDESDTGGGPDSGTCVIATHAVAAKSFSARDKAKAEVWCARKYHGKWYGELFRKGYRHAGKKAIKRGEAENHYQEFKDFVSYGRGLKSGWRYSVNYYRRTAQFFLTGLMLTVCEKFKAK